MFFHVDDWESWRHNTPGWAWLADPRGRHSAASPSCTARPHWPRSTEENCPHLWSSRCPTGKKGLAYRSSADNVIDLLSCIDVRVCTLILHTHTQPFNGLWSGTTRVGRYQKKHSPTHTNPDHRTSFIIFLHLQRSMASYLFSLRAWQSILHQKQITQVFVGYFGNSGLLFLYVAGSSSSGLFSSSHALLSVKG